MAYTLYITSAEAEAAANAEIDGVEGSTFTYSPKDADEIMSKLLKGTDPAAIRLAGRVAEIKGRELATIAKAPELTAADVFPGEVQTLEINPAKAGRQKARADA